MKRSHHYQPYLDDIADCIDRIRRYTEGADLDSFLANDLLQDAIIRRMEIMGEAVNRLPDYLKKRYPEIPWQDIRTMRNKLVHEYGHVDPVLVWGVVRSEIPRLAVQIRKVMDDLS